MVVNNNQINTEPIFSLKRTNNAASRNIKILEAFNGNLCAAIAAQKNSPLNYRPELRNTADLERLLQYQDDQSTIIIYLIRPSQVPCSIEVDDED